MTGIDLRPPVVSSSAGVQVKSFVFNASMGTVKWHWSLNTLSLSFDCIGNPLTKIMLVPQTPYLAPKIWCRSNLQYLYFRYIFDAPQKKTCEAKVETETMQIRDNITLLQFDWCYAGCFTCYVPEVHFHIGPLPGLHRLPWVQFLWTTAFVSEHTFPSKMDRNFERCGSDRVEAFTSHFWWWNIEVIALYVGKVTHLYVNQG